MTFNHNNIGSNPIILIVGVLSLIFLALSNSFNLRRDLSLLFSRVSMIILLYSAILGYCGIFIISTSPGVGIYSGLFNINCYTNFFHVFIYILTIFILILTGFYSRKIWIKKLSSLYYILNNKLIYNNTSITGKKDEKYSIIEYPLIILFVLIGANFLISTSDIVSIFLSIELQSYGLYLFSTLYRNSELATSGGLTYFLLGGLSSCFILLGTGLLYANSGTTSLDNIYIINHISEINIYNGYQDLYWYKPFYIYMSLLIMSVGFLFKVSAAPFHFWSPDVYDAIPTIVTTFVAIIAKISIFIFLLELVYHTGSFITNFSNDWKTGLLTSCLLSLIIGTIVGLTQFRIKRLYAYSTISHLGFILLSLSIYKIESIQSFIFYLTQYSVSNLNAFIILISIGYSLYIYVNNNTQHETMLDKNNSPIQLISQLKGYFYINSILALSLCITLFSLIGIPPLIGFFAKQNVLSASLNNGYVFITFVAIITSVISAVYYLAIIKQVFFDKSDYEINSSLINLNSYVIDPTNSYSKTKIMIEDIKISSGLSITISILTIIMGVFIFISHEWLSLANLIALGLFEP